MANQNISMIRGDTLAFGFEIDGSNQELDTAYFTCKSDINNIEPLFQKSLNDGIEIASTTNNSISYRVRVAPEDTYNLEAGNYNYDLQIGLNGDIYTILIGILSLNEDVTRNEVLSV